MAACAALMPTLAVAAAPCIKLSGLTRPGVAAGASARALAAALSTRVNQSDRCEVTADRSRVDALTFGGPSDETGGFRHSP